MRDRTRQLLFLLIALSIPYSCVKEEECLQRHEKDFFRCANQQLEPVISTLREIEVQHPFATDFMAVYGTPLWEYSDIITEGEQTSYFVPVYDKAFPKAIYTIWFFRIKDGRMIYAPLQKAHETLRLCEQTLLFDYLAFKIWGKDNASGLSFKSVTDTRAWVTVTTCRDAYVEVGDVSEYKGTTCSNSTVWADVVTKEYLSSSLTPSSGGGEVSIVGAGSGSSSGGSSSSNATNTTTEETLDSNPQLTESTRAKIIEELAKNCGLAAAISDAGGLNFTVATSDEYTGAYNAISDELLMNTAWDGDVTSKTFIEELVHYLQDQLYEGGIDTKLISARTNIEFEAKVIVDLYTYGKNSNLYRGESMVLQRIRVEDISTRKYITFLQNITQAEITGEAYQEMMNLFNQYTPYTSYKNRIDESLTPILVECYGLDLSSNNCN